MQKHIKSRVIMHANLFISDVSNTVRSVSKKSNWSKSTVAIDLQERLPQIDGALYDEVIKQLGYNKAVRHLRGGEATRLKYMGDKK